MARKFTSLTEVTKEQYNCFLVWFREVHGDTNVHSLSSGDIHFGSKIIVCMCNRETGVYVIDNNFYAEWKCYGV